MSKFYRFFKFNNDNTEITLEGASINLGSSGVTIAAGGQTITAGDVKLVNGTLYAGQKIFVGATTNTGTALFTGTVAPTSYFGKGSLYIDTASASVYIQTAADAWTELTKKS